MKPNKWQTTTGPSVSNKRAITLHHPTIIPTMSEETDNHGKVELKFVVGEGDNEMVFHKIELDMDDILDKYFNSDSTIEDIIKEAFNEA